MRSAVAASSQGAAHMQPAIWSRWPLRRRPLCALHQPSHRMHGCTTVATPTVLGGVAVEVTADYSRRVARGDSGRESWRGARATRGGGRESVVGWVATALRLLSGMRLKTLYTQTTHQFWFAFCAFRGRARALALAEYERVLGRRVAWPYLAQLEPLASQVRQHYHGPEPRGPRGDAPPLSSSASVLRARECARLDVPLLSEHAAFWVAALSP